MARDSEKELLIRMIRDYSKEKSVSELRQMDFAALAALYKQLRGY